MGLPRTCSYVHIGFFTAKSQWACLCCSKNNPQTLCVLQGQSSSPGVYISIQGWGRGLSSSWSSFRILMAALPSGTLLAAMMLGREDNLGLALLCLLLTKTHVTSIHGSLAYLTLRGVKMQSSWAQKEREMDMELAAMSAPT